MGLFGKAAAVVGITTAIVGGVRAPTDVVRQGDDWLKGSASERTAEPDVEGSMSSSTSGPASSPTATNTIAGVTGVPLSRPDTAATARIERARIGTAQFTVRDYLRNYSPVCRAKRVMRKRAAALASVLSGRPSKGGAGRWPFHLDRVMPRPSR